MLVSGQACERVDDDDVSLWFLHSVAAEPDDTIEFNFAKRARRLCTNLYVRKLKICVSLYRFTFYHKYFVFSSFMRQVIISSAFQVSAKISTCVGTPFSERKVVDSKQYTICNLNRRKRRRISSIIRL